MPKQTLKIDADTGAKLAGQSQNLIFTADRAHNVHGLRVDINIESEAMEANANGNWAVYLLPGSAITASSLSETWSQWADETVSQYLWGHGLWMASNQTPFHTTFAPKTSRNITKNGRIFVKVWVEGTLPVLTANRINIMMSHFADQ